MAVFSQTTGQLDGILIDNGWLTDLRTAAAGTLLSLLRWKSVWLEV
jgi:ornithine cyclodeaminase/alanine dehydrogenase-like protein (mu-crystallin family)